MDLYHLTKYEVDRLRNAEIRRILSCQPRGRIVDTRHDIDHRCKKRFLRLFFIFPTFSKIKNVENLT